MKNIFKIHPLTYLILISVLLCGYFNYFLIISMILIIHDLGHVIFFKIFKYQINEILILPFGSIIKANLSSNSPTYENFLISIAGVLMQVALYFVVPLLSISDLSYHIFLKYNSLLMFFNLLPIIPLDGSKILLCFLESHLSYKRALKVLNVISISMILFLIWYVAARDLNSYLMIAFLAYKTYETIKNHEYLFHHFLVIRLMRKDSFKHLKKIDSITKIFKNKYNLINGESEEKVLSRYFKI